ncbi:hypothetical protein FACS18945_0050 [Bacteroidia bacterium]|nr:hypothetical protein FACS189434_03930 [Bacteroidia bacterium]GHT56978.1 hypothetical protein FACS18945_0050 [Bacteroidia bacterium]
MDFKSLVKQIQSVQSALQASAAHAINTALTIRNWLIGYYIVEFEQNGEDRAKYGEKLLQNLENKLKTKGMNERRFREYRRFYVVYPQISSEITNFLPIDPIRRLTAEFQIVDNKKDKWQLPANFLLSKISYSHFDKISQIENPIKRAFYELGGKIKVVQN